VFQLFFTNSLGTIEQQFIGKQPASGKKAIFISDSIFTGIHVEEAPGCLSLLDENLQGHKDKRLGHNFDLNIRAVPSRCLLIFTNYAVKETIKRKHKFNYLITMKRLFLLIFLLNILLALNAQKFMTKNGYIGFFSHTSMEDIKGDNNRWQRLLIFQLEKWYSRHLSNHFISTGPLWKNISMKTIWNRISS